MHYDLATPIRPKGEAEPRPWFAKLTHSSIVLVYMRLNLYQTY